MAKELTNDQFGELIAQFVELQDEIKYSFDEETLDELIDNVTSETTEVI